MNLGIIGCGTIAATYLQALSHLGNRFRIAALCDSCREKALALGLPGVPVFTDADALAALPEVECVVISTPVSTHAALAACCLRRGKHVLLEKPATLSLPELESLYALAEEMGVTLQVAFHSSFGADIDWYLEHRQALAHRFDPKRLRGLECRFYDPYMPDGRILEDRKGLGGSYADSGVNILSVCARLTDLEDFSPESHRVSKQDGVVYASETVFRGGDIRLTACTGWDLGRNHKSTLLRFDGTPEQLLLDHTGQAVRVVGPAGEETLYRQSRLPRMVCQYIRVFAVFHATLRTGAPEQQRQALQVHRLLLAPQAL